MNTYEEKILKAISFIQNNLENNLIWNDISKLCGISEFHFHRIFSTYMGETPGEFIKRKRLEKAAMNMVYNSKELPLTEIALICGYSSQANLSKAIKQYFGVTPGEIIKGQGTKNSKIGKIKSKYGKDFSVKELYPNSELEHTRKEYLKESLMNVEIKSMAVRPVIYKSSEKGYLVSSIHKTWDDLIEKACYLPMEKDNFVMYGIGHDNPQITPEEKCRYDACIQIEEGVEVGSDFSTKQLPSGKYACFYFKGHSKDLIQFYLSIYANWFPKSGHEPGDHPLIEHYFDVDKETGDIELEVQFLLK
jgi:AraC family transcriptional regulator